MKPFGKEATRWPVLVCAFVISLLGVVLPGHAAHALSVDITATPQVVGPYQPSVLEWRSQGAKWCYSRGVWGGSRKLNGTFNTGRLSGKTWYGITCSDGKQEVSDSVTVVVRDDLADLRVDITATPQVIGANESTTLRWASVGAKWCYSRGVWGGSRNRNGTFNTGPLTGKTWYGITCSDGNREVSDSVTVVVRDAQEPLNVDLTASPYWVDHNGSSTLKWTSTGAKWCYSRGVWGSSRSRQGSYDTGPLGGRTWFGITCSDGKNEVSDAVTINVRQPELSVDLTAAPYVVDRNGSSTLSWTSKGAKWCYSRGVWGGSRSRQGSYNTGPLSGKTWFGITCSDGENEVSDAVTVVVREDTADLAVNLKANPSSVRRGESSTLTWSSQAADSCAASGAWSGTRSKNGTFNTGPLWQDKSYRLTCRRGNETALSSVTVKVATVPVVRWQAPGQNVDGTALDDLTGYRFYWGQSSRNYSGSARVNGASTTEYQPTQLASGRYFVAVTALDAEGNESDYSNEVQIEIP